MRKEYLEFIGEQNTVLPAVIWLPEGETKGILQVVHGMTEHIGRYENMARVLTAYGIAVAGFDLRGHGKSAQGGKCASLGEGGWEKSIREIHQFHQKMKERFQEEKHYLMGFSLGSFLVREYFSIYENSDFAGTIIMGTGQQPAFLLAIIMKIVQGEIKKSGFDCTTDLVRNLSFRTYNKKFAPNRTKADWLCADEKELDVYIADELCKEDISAGMFWQLLNSMKRLANQNTYEKWNKEMKVLLLSGEEDPVGDAGKGVRMVEKAMKKAGLRNINVKIYPGGRHDVLHECESGISANVCDVIAEILV